MKMKLHLSARAPNEGARVLARWVIQSHSGDLVKAAASLSKTAAISGCEASFVQRVIDGETTPGLIIGTAMSRLCGVSAGMFSSPAAGGWFDEAPLARAA